MGALNVAASRRGYAGLVPDRILNAISCFFAPLTLTADVSGQFMIDRTAAYLFRYSGHATESNDAASKNASLRTLSIYVK